MGYARDRDFARRMTWLFFIQKKMKKWDLNPLQEKNKKVRWNTDGKKVRKKKDWNGARRPYLPGRNLERNFGSDPKLFCETSKPWFLYFGLKKLVQ